MKNKEKAIGGLILLFIISTFIFVGYNNTKPDKLTDEDKNKIFIDIPIDTISNNDNTSKPKIIVEIKGEVNKPDVYLLDEGSRIYELIDMAGGITDKGDLSSINRASTLVDGQCIVVKDKTSLGNNELTGNLGAISTSSLGSERININIASKDDLMKLSGIGESKAEAIIQYRSKNGYFKRVEDLQHVDGIGEKTVERLKDKISVN